MLLRSANSPAASPDTKGSDGTYNSTFTYFYFSLYVLFFFSFSFSWKVRIDRTSSFTGSESSASASTHSSRLLSASLLVAASYVAPFTLAMFWDFEWRIHVIHYAPCITLYDCHYYIYVPVCQQPPYAASYILNENKSQWLVLPTVCDNICLGCLMEESNSLVGLPKIN